MIHVKTWRDQENYKIYERKPLEKDQVDDQEGGNAISIKVNLRQIVKSGGRWDSHMKKIIEDLTGLYCRGDCVLGFVYLFLARQPPVGQGPLIHVVSRSHTTTCRSW